jgi:hypothetical protein
LANPLRDGGIDRRETVAVHGGLQRLDVLGDGVVIHCGAGGFGRHQPYRVAEQAAIGECEPHG